jgi:hypothetical protein
VDDRDCPPGSSCEEDATANASACIEQLSELCVYNSDCGPPRICGPDQQSRYECVRDEDCDPLRYCNMAVYRCYPRGDAGP